ncbi:MAG: hypothetical protein GY757_16490, partial [bacterium]|nr:hypothetical protein [bacterium]
FTKLGIEPGESYVRVDNPKTLNQRVLRNHLMTGMLETFEKNKKKAVPQHIFELGSVTDVNPESETGVDEYRNLGFAIIGPDAGYAEARALLDSVLRELGLTGQYRAVEHSSFLSGRCAEVRGADGLWARVGEMHPRVITNFGLAFPIAYCELRLAKVF